MCGGNRKLKCAKKVYSVEFDKSRVLCVIRSLKFAVHVV